jgi:hypothetical protein
VYFTRPPRELIEQMDALFQGVSRQPHADLVQGEPA